MKTNSKRCMIVAAAAALLALFPASARASGPDCTDEYMLCLNEAAGNYDDWGEAHFDIADDLAYIECAAEWTGCVRKKLIGV